MFPGHEKPACTEHQPPVAVTMSIAWLALKLVRRRPGGKLVCPKNCTNLSLRVALSKTSDMKKKSSTEPVEYPDNTIALACMQVTRSSADNGGNVYKEETAYASFSLIY